VFVWQQAGNCCYDLVDGNYTRGGFNFTDLTKTQHPYSHYTVILQGDDELILLMGRWGDAIQTGTFTSRTINVKCAAVERTARAVTWRVRNDDPTRRNEEKIYLHVGWGRRDKKYVTNKNKTNCVDEVVVGWVEGSSLDTSVVIFDWKEITMFTLRKIRPS